MVQRFVKEYRVLVGLEVHVQLATRSKMFTAAPNGATNFGAEPNSLVDEVVLGLPGALPVLNRTAVEYSIMVGLALGCKIARHTKWDRKSYYYPDLPKNYQISQYDLPLCYEGVFELQQREGAKPHAVRIRRAHLEEDAGKLLHEAPGGYPIDWSIVDLNRAGTPLLEIVTEPDFSTPEQVRVFAQELQKLVQFLGVSEGQMERGHMRFEPNINVHITDSAGVVHPTAITEIKNLNSFSVLERATAYEVRRQIDQWVQTGSLGRKSTYGWDEKTESTFHQRDKEDAHDYRYFPDPDLAPVEVSDEWLTELKSRVGELPAARRRRYVEALGLSPADAATLAAERDIGDFFEQAIHAGGSAKRVANLLLAHGLRIINETKRRIDSLGLTPEMFADVAKIVDAGKLAPSAAGKFFDTQVRTEPMVNELSVSERISFNESATIEHKLAEMGLLQSSDTAPIDAAIDALIAQNPKSLQDVRAGKIAALGSLVGMIMKGGKGLNPKLVQERLRERLELNH